MDTRNNADAAFLQLPFLSLPIYSFAVQLACIITESGWAFVENVEAHIIEALLSQKGRWR